MMRNFLSTLLAGGLALAPMSSVMAAQQTIGVGPNYDLDSLYRATIKADRNFSEIYSLAKVLPPDVYRSALPGIYQTTDSTAYDASGAGGDALVTAALTPATAFATPGYFSSAAGSGLGLYIEQSRIKFDPAQNQSLLVSMCINMALPGATTPIAGNGSSFNTIQGLEFSARPTGKIRPFLTTSTGNVTSIAETTKTLLDGTDHCFAVAVDGRTKSIFDFTDGALDTYAYNVFTGSVTSPSNWNFGTSGTAGALSGSTTAAAKFFGFHAFVFQGSLPANFGDMIARLHANPRQVLDRRSILTASTNAVIGIIGQSNEQGASGYADTNSRFGVPRRDGGSGSMWPRVQALAGKVGANLYVSNTAIGTTSLAKSWTGQIQPWVSGMFIVKGSMVIDPAQPNILYQSNLPQGSAVASTTTPAVGTGADTIPWVSLGAPGPTDILNRVLREGDAHFDPNGYIAAALAGINNQPGMDFKGLLISIGQGDKTVGTPRSDFAQAYTNITNYFLARSIKVAIGFTCYAATTGAEAYYQSDLLPGVADAQAAFATNPNVIAGANLRNLLGVLPTTPAVGYGLQADLLHMNRQALAAAADGEFAAFQAGGWLPAAAQ